MGHVRNRGKRKDGSTIWQARIPDPARPGGNAQIERSFRLKSEAEAWIVSELATQHAGEWIDPRRGERPFRELAEAWKESWHRLSPTTASRYRSILDVYLVPDFGHVPVAKITHEVVQRYVDQLASEKDDDEKPLHAPGTILNVYSVLRNALNTGVRLGIVRINPCTKIRLPRSPKEEMLFLAPEEVCALAEKIDKHYRVLIYVAAYTGLRAGELGALRRADVDLLRGVIHVRRALKDVDGRLQFGPTKTHTTRTVSLPAFLRDMLRDHLASPAALSGGNGPEALVFPSKTGGPLRHNLFYRRHFKRAVAGWTDKKGNVHPGALPERLHGLRFHDLRHTAAALSIAAGAHPKLISARLGHSSVQITLDRYAHLFPSVEEALAEKLDALYHATPEPQPANVVALLSETR